MSNSSLQLAESALKDRPVHCGRIRQEGQGGSTVGENWKKKLRLINVTSGLCGGASDCFLLGQAEADMLMVRVLECVGAGCPL